MVRSSFVVLDQGGLESSFDVLIIDNGGKWLRTPVNNKEANKQVKIYVKRSLTLHIFCFMLNDYA